MDNREERDERQRKKSAYDKARQTYRIARKSLKSVRTTIRFVRLATRIALRLIVNPYTGTFGSLLLLVFLVLILQGQIGISPFGLGGGGDDDDEEQILAPPLGLDGPSLPEIPGLNLSLLGPDDIENDGELIYTLEIVYDETVSGIPIEDITIYNPLPANTTFLRTDGIPLSNPGESVYSWSLAEPENQDGFSIILKPKLSNIQVVNYVYARAEGITPITGGSCNVGTGECSVEYLSSYFETQQAAYEASVICQRESGSDPGALNNGCLTGESADYSVGLFQINLLAHCPGAFSDYTLNPPSCTISSQAILDQCYERFSDPRENILYTRELSRASFGDPDWGPWSGAAACNIN